MKSPLWIITSVLTLLFVALLVFVLASLRTLFVPPATTSLRVPKDVAVDIQEAVTPKDLNVIYEERDLFSTYQPAITPVKKVETIPTIPPAPSPQPPVIPTPQKVQFLPPLSLKISGIIASTTDAKSQVSLVNTNTGTTESYKMGDQVLDATIIRIFPRKIIVVRSNGQLETLYMFPEDAIKVSTQEQDTTWADVIFQRGDGEFIVRPKNFMARVASLAQLFDMLNLTTVSEDGEQIGLRVGIMQPTSLGIAAGLQPGDIILKVLDKEVTKTADRIAIYNAIADYETLERVPVEIRRDGTVYAHTYSIKDSLAQQELAPIEPLPAGQQATLMQPIATPAMPSSMTQLQPFRPQGGQDIDMMKRYGGKSAAMGPRR